MIIGNLISFGDVSSVLAPITFFHMVECIFKQGWPI